MEHFEKSKRIKENWQPKREEKGIMAGRADGSGTWIDEVSWVVCEWVISVLTAAEVGWLWWDGPAERGIIQSFNHSVGLVSDMPPR